MKKIKNNDKTMIKFLIGILCLIVLIIPAIVHITNSAIASSKKSIYLSDIPYVVDQSFVGWGSITLDKNLQSNSNGGLITLLIDGVKTNFLKGISAHATSNVVYDLSDYEYDYFTAYIGLDASMGTSGNGVKFFIYTSVDGENWELKTEEVPPVYKGNSDAKFVKIDIKGAKYLKLVCDSNGNNTTSDHGVYANAKLIKADYVETTTPLTFIKTVSQYDNIIKQSDFNIEEKELVLLQREFVNNVGYTMLQNIGNLGEEYKETIKWLFTDKENLKMYIMGGKPDGSYYNSLKVLTQLYTKYKNDFAIQEVSKYGTVRGDLYKKMAITLSLTHSSTVALWMQPSNPGNQSDAVKRYEIFKYLYDNNKFVVTDTIDITKWFENYNVEEMRFVLNTMLDDEEILWLNEYTQSYIDKYPNQAWKYLTPHPYMAYVWPNYGNPVFHDPDRKDYWDEKFGGIFSKYNVTYSTETNKVYKVWMNFRNEFGTGAVCGGISKTGSNIRGVHGIPAAVIGQPGHAAIIYYTQDANGNGYWGIDNDVSGWTLSEKSERMLLGWGNASYARGSYQVVYMALAQEVLNDYENFEKAEEMIMLAKVYNNDLVKQEEFYRKALEIQPINIDAWYGLINTYLNNPNKTEDDFYALAEELANALKYFPLPMYHLTNLIKPKLTEVTNVYKFTLLQTGILTEGSQTPNNTADKYYVYQPSLTRLEANFLLGKIDKSIATFSFDGNDAGKIVLSSRFDGNGIRWDYSIDGKQTWNEVSFTAEEAHKYLLSDEQISKITADNDIYIHIVGVSYDEKNIFKIDIENQDTPNLYGNDLENKVMGTNDVTEWRYNDKEEWSRFNVTKPDLTGNKTVQIRYAPTGTKLTSDIQTLTFTKDEIVDTRKYVTVDHLSIAGVSTEATGNNGHAKYAIDGDYNTRWHSNWGGSDNERYIIIKLDQSIALSALEYFPASGGNGKILEGTILGSKDGKDYTELAHVSWANNETKKTIEFEEKTEVMYIKIVGNRTSTAGGGNFIAARMFNIYEDATQDLHPKAELEFSITQPTNKDVIVKLVNPSTDITITNNNGKDSYTFTENGEFTFEFEDSITKKTGKITAKVDWIDKIAPTATIHYSTTANTYGPVIATLTSISEPITMLDGNATRMYVFTQNGEYEFVYQDAAGNIGKTVAKVDWIQQKPSKPDESGNQGSTTKPDGSGNQGSTTKPDGSGNQGSTTKPDGSGNQGSTTKPDGSGNQGSTTKPDGSGNQDPTIKPDDGDTKKDNEIKENRMQAIFDKVVSCVIPAIAMTVGVWLLFIISDDRKRGENHQK